jgi:signal transduction histidine kinase
VSIATRVTLLSVLLVVMTLGLYGFFTLRGRHAELLSAQERQTQLFGATLSASIEAALQDGLFEDVPGLIQRMRAAEQTIGVVYVDLVRPGDATAFGPGVEQQSNGQKDPAREYPLPRPDPGRDERVRRVAITGQPYGERVQVDDKPVYAYTLPLRGGQHKLVAAVDLTVSQAEVERVFLQAARDVTLALAALSALLAILIGLTVRQEMAQPLLRLVGGIDEVTRGDYTGAILRERSDEIGVLADRFNEMTRSLRKAREEILAGVNAKLQLEQRLRHSDKLATIGQLAAGIAHEVGTPLNVIGGRARVMARRAEDPKAVEKNADIIASQAERITKIIQQLLDYARRKAPARAGLDLSLVCRSTLEFLEHQLETRGIVATLHPYTRTDAPPAHSSSSSNPKGNGGVLPPREPLVFGDADQLQQVSLNLCINAIQAMPEGGELHLHLEGLVRKKPGLDRALPSAYVLLSVSDTGIGIDEAHIGRIFEPFYSTKNAESDPGDSGGASKSGSGGGSGLGLSVSTGIVKDHDGWIECERRPSPQRGTTFRVFLPAELPPELHGSGPASQPRAGALDIESDPRDVVSQTRDVV